MRIHRRCWFVAACLALAALALAGWWLQPQRQPVRFAPALYAQIRLGMKIEDVLDLLGPTSSGRIDRTTYQVVEQAASAAALTRSVVVGPYLEWFDDEGGIEVATSEGAVVLKNRLERVPAWRAVMFWLRGLVGL